MLGHVFLDFGCSGFCIYLCKRIPRRLQRGGHFDRQPRHAPPAGPGLGRRCGAALPFAVLLIGSSVSDTIKKLVGRSFLYCARRPAGCACFHHGGNLAAILWNVTTWRFGIPRLILPRPHRRRGGRRYGGLWHWRHLLGVLLGKVVLMIFLTPSVSFAAGFLILKLLLT